MDLFLNNFVLSNRCTHKSQCTTRCRCPVLCSINLSSLDAFCRSHFSHSLCATSTVLLSDYPRFFCVKFSKGLKFIVSSSTFRFEVRNSSAVLSFYSCGICFGFRIKCWILFLSISKNTCFLAS